MPTPTFSLDSFSINASSPQVMATLRAIVWNETHMKISDAFSVYINGNPNDGVMASFGPVHFNPKTNPEGTADFAVSVLRAAGNDTIANAIEGRSTPKLLVLTSDDYTAINNALQTDAGRQAAVNRSVTQVETLIEKAKGFLPEGVRSNQALLSLIVDYANKAGFEPGITVTVH